MVRQVAPRVNAEDRWDVGGIFGTADHGRGGPMVRYGKPAPDFSLPDIQDRPVTLAEHRGKDVVLVFYCYDWGSI
jgi:hypothetical protein